MGDVPGVLSRLPYLAGLGIDAIWLTPVYPSPLVDGGYDVADYRDVDAGLGSLAVLDELVAEAHRQGLRLIMDLVPNHTSTEHPWFRAALSSPAGSPERARYLFRDGRGRHGDEPPNDWLSNFGGPAWTRHTGTGDGPGQWYLHLFSPGQPDLDWTNEEVRAEFDSILRFWFDRGVDGFRIDVAHGLAKDPALPDLAGRFPPELSSRHGHPHWDRDEVHDVYRRWRTLTDSCTGERALVGEAWVDGPGRLARYVRPDELHTAFNFDFLLAPWDASALRAVIERSLASHAEVGAVPTWVLSNHDVIRHATRYGGGAAGVRRARAAALLMLALPGGVCLYQGEELGLEEVTDLPDEVLRDPTFVSTGGARRGRDGSRVPLPWSGTAPPFAFGSDGSWLPQPPGWAERTVERQAGDPGSMLSLYRTALQLRRTTFAVDETPLTWMRAAPQVLAFHRGRDLACVVNAGDRPAGAPGEVAGLQPVLASGPLARGGRVARETAVWFARRQDREPPG